MVVPSQHYHNHSLIEVREEIENVVVDEHVVGANETEDGIGDDEASIWHNSMASMSSCSLTEQLVELSTLADFVTCRDVQAPLHIVQPPEFPKLPTFTTRPIFHDDFLREMETLGEFLGLRSSEANGASNIPPRTPTSISATAPTPLAKNTTRVSSPVVITNEIRSRAALPPRAESSHEPPLVSPHSPLPDPPSVRDSYRTSTQPKAAQANTVAPTTSEVYMCPVAPSTPREHAYRNSTPTGHHRVIQGSGPYPPHSPVVLADDEPIPNLSSLNVLPEENEPLVAIDEEESGRTSMRVVRDEDSSSISYYQPRRRSSPSPPRSPSPVGAHVTYAQHHVSPPTVPSPSRTTQRRSSARPTPNPTSSNRSQSKNRVESTALTMNRASKRTVSQPISQQPHQPYQQQSYQHQPQYQQQQKSKSKRYPQEPPPHSRPRRAMPPPYQSAASTTTATSVSSSHHPYHQFYSPNQDSDTVRAVAPRKPPTGTFSQEESSAVSSTGQQKVMIVVVRRPNHTNSSPRRHHNDMDLGLE